MRIFGKPWRIMCSVCNQAHLDVLRGIGCLRTTSHSTTVQQNETMDHLLLSFNSAHTITREVASARKEADEGGLGAT